MLDLDTIPVIPRYELKLRGETQPKTYDPVLLGYELRELTGQEDPKIICQVVNKVFGTDVDALTAGAIMKDFIAHSEAHLDEPLKNIFGQGFYSDTTTDSQENSSDN